MSKAQTETRTWKVGGYSKTFHARTAGQFGCDPCLCGYRPAAGETVWMNSYGDLTCDRCATRRSTPTYQSDALGTVTIPED